MTKKQRKFIDKLNSIIHAQNLYMRGERFIDARMIGDKCFVKSLNSGIDVEFNNGVEWKNGRGEKIVIDN